MQEIEAKDLVVGQSYQLANLENVWGVDFFSGLPHNYLLQRPIYLSKKEIVPRNELTYVPLEMRSRTNIPDTLYRFIFRLDNIGNIIATITLPNQTFLTFIPSAESAAKRRGGKRRNTRRNLNRKRRTIYKRK